METIVDSGCVDLGSLHSPEVTSFQEVVEDMKLTQEEEKKEEEKKEEEKKEEKKRITPTQIALKEENILAALKLIGQHIKKVEEEVSKFSDRFDGVGKKLEDVVKEMNKSVSSSKRNHKQLVATLQQLIDEQFGSDDSDSDDSDFKVKRKRK